LLIIPAGANTLRIVPPLIITRPEIDLLIERLSAVFADL
jgi:4-aminobutyrate aminotransferase-like enzyme